LDKSKQPISLGSGFVVDNGKVITNVHVMKGAVYGEIIEDQTKKTHKIVGYLAIDKINDLILLSVPTLEVDKLALSEKTPEIGEKIYAIGNPKGLSGTISEGIVSGIRKIENNDLIQITAPISPGSSGGPIINNNGEVIAVSVASLTSGQNLNFAIPAKYVNNILSKNIDSVTQLNIPNVNTTSTKTKSVSIDQGVFISNIVWGNNGEYGVFDQYLSRFSITNNTENEIKEMEVEFPDFKKEYLDRFIEAVKKAGNPEESDTFIKHMINEEEMMIVKRAIQDAKSVVIEEVEEKKEV
jgi:S1-C subfamily serine protease